MMSDPRHVFLLLGPPIHDAHKRRENVFYYSYDAPNGDPKILFERSFLDERMFKVSSDHLAEFGVFHVLAQKNPIGLRDDDTLTMVSSRKFEAFCQVHFEELFTLTDVTLEFLREGPHILSFFAPPDRDLRIADRCSFFHVDSWDAEACASLARATGLRSQFTNYPPVWRNYFTFSYRTLRLFYAWCMEHLVPVLFTEDFSPRRSVMDAISSPTTRYQNYRLFGLFFEYFYHRYFRDLGAFHYVLERAQRLYRIDYTNDDLDWTVEFIGQTIIINYGRPMLLSLNDVDRVVRESRATGKRVVVVGTGAVAYSALSGTNLLSANVVGVAGDDARWVGRRFCGIPVVPMKSLEQGVADIIVVADTPVGGALARLEGSRVPVVRLAASDLGTEARDTARERPRRG